MDSDELTVTEILHQIGVPAHIKGYQFLRDAILLTMNEPEYILSLIHISTPRGATAFLLRPCSSRPALLKKQAIQRIRRPKTQNNLRVSIFFAKIFQNFQRFILVKSMVLRELHTLEETTMDKVRFLM